MQHPTDPDWRIDGGEYADIVATGEELLGEGFDVPVHAALERPGIWRDKTYAHEHLRVVDRAACRRTTTRSLGEDYAAGVDLPA